MQFLRLGPVGDERPAVKVDDGTTYDLLPITPDIDGSFLANDGVCPLTPLAERLGATRGAVSDIFLPDAVARTIPIWSTALLVVAALLHARSALRAGGGRSESTRAGLDGNVSAARG